LKVTNNKSHEKAFSFYLTGIRVYRLSLKNKNNSLSKLENLNRREWLIVNINSSMSNDTETNDRDREIDILKSTIDSLTQENKQLLESNKQLKKEYDKLRTFNISIFAPELETQIQHILGRSTALLKYYESPQQYPNWGRENIVRMTYMTRNTALKLRMQIENMKREVSESKVRDLPYKH
jgi:hypothetical protein